MSSTTPPTNLLYVVSTSHMDWDWNLTFEQYYSNGTDPNTPAVRYILDNAIALMGTATLSPPYQYNLAEVAWLQRYMQDNPTLQQTLNAIPGINSQLLMLGGGVTSPDNLVCNGEAFIRNYLYGRAFLQKAGLLNLVTNICWIPDDFGHDPQLPVVLAAMGMQGASFWRVPGNEPAKQGMNPPEPQYKPTNPNIPSLAQQLSENGVTFFWRAADGSTVLAQQMWDSYGVVWNQSEPTQTVTVNGKPEVLTQAQVLNWFVTQGVSQPGNLYMAPCGGDFSLPSTSSNSSNLLDAVNDYNSIFEPQTGITAIIGTFSDYVTAVQQYAANPTMGSVPTRAMDASNFWTGLFASRPQLKINQQRSVNLLMAAETLTTLLRVQSAYSASVMQGLMNAINTAWQNLLPSTHHDYVTGTSPDTVYWQEQLPLSALTLRQSEAALAEAVSLFANAIQPSTGQQGIPYLIYNPVGTTRSTVGALLEIPITDAELAKVQSVYIESLKSSMAVQITSSGKIVFPLVDQGSTAYTTVYLSPNTVAPPPPPTMCTNSINTDFITLSNGVVQITIDTSKAYSLFSIIDVQNGCNELLPYESSRGNVIQLYYEMDSNKTTPYGNLYQMGNEFAPTSTDGEGFFRDSTSDFEVIDGGIVENGPYLWHFRGTIKNTISVSDPTLRDPHRTTEITTTLTVEYFLEYQEPLVRIRITGNAPGNSSNSLATSIVTTWDMVDARGIPTVTGMEYGTPNHWNGADFVPYWNGPTFRPVHDYCSFVPNADVLANPLVPALYNEGMHAWALNNNQLLGILFRNPTNTNRGAWGTDTATHVQNYAYRIPGVGSPQSCQPLQESLCFQLRQIAAPLSTNPTDAVVNTLSDSGSLVSLNAPNALIRVARTQEGSGGVAANDNGNEQQSLPFSFVVRLYQPTNQPIQNLEVNIPSANGTNNVARGFVGHGAEQELSTAQQPTYNNGVITIPETGTLTTLRVQSTTD